MELGWGMQLELATSSPSRHALADLTRTVYYEKLGKNEDLSGYDAPKRNYCLGLFSINQPFFSVRCVVIQCEIWRIADVA